MFPGIRWKIIWMWVLVGVWTPVVGQRAEGVIISGDYQEASLVSVFAQWQADHGLLFSYRQDLVESVEISASFKKKTLIQALEIVLRETNLEANIRDGRFILITQKQLVYRLCGCLRDSLTREPVSFANIRHQTSSIGTVSRPDGTFVLRGLNEGTQRLSISHLGYAAKALQLSPTTGPCPNIYLTAQAMEIEGVAISEYLTDGISQGPQAIHLQPKRVTALPGQIEPDVFQMVQILPGVNSPNGTATSLHIRGGTPDQTRVLYNDIPLYQTGHFFDMISAINPFAVEQAEVYRGGFSVGLPGGVSGLVNIHQASEIPEKISGGANLNFTHAGAQLNVPLQSGKAGVFISARRSITDLVQSPTFQRLQERVFQETRLGEQREEDELELERDDFRFWDGSVRLLWHPNERNKLEFNVYRGANTLNFEVQEANEDTYAEDILLISNGGGSLKWNRQRSPQHQQETILSYSEYLFDYDFQWTTLEEQRPLESIYKSNQLKDFRLRHTHFHTWAKQHKLQVGLESTWQEANLIVDLAWPEDSFRENISTNGFTQNLFGQYQYRPGDRFSLTTGMRFSYHSDLQKGFTAPRIIAQFQPVPAWRFTLTAGRYYQFVSQLIEWEFDNLGISNQIWAISQDDFLPAVRSDQLGMGLLFKRKSWLVDVELYYK
ncbi:MAG: TonB-dependent receptor, partial [Bacteroidota bacterium]